MKRLRFIETLWLLIHESDYLIDRKKMLQKWVCLLMIVFLVFQMDALANSEAEGIL